MEEKKKVQFTFKWGKIIYFPFIWGLCLLRGLKLYLNLVPTLAE